MSATSEFFVCPDCDHTKSKIEYLADEFEYGAGDKQVILKTVVPVEVCLACGAQLNTEQGDIIRHAAVCRHLEILSPAEIRHIRTAAAMSQARFSEVTGIGTASISRWESGQLIQGKGHDNLLRLMESSLNREYLAARCNGERASLRQLELKAIDLRVNVLSGPKLANAMEASREFQLRKVK